MAQKPPNKTSTQPGLGQGGGDALPRMDSAEMKRVRRSMQESPEPARATTPPAAVRPRLRDSVRREDPDDPPVEPAAASVRPRLRDSVRREDPDDVPPAPSSRGRFATEAPTGTRRKEDDAKGSGGRAAVTVDKVGAAAVKLARTTRRDTAPKLVASRAIIAKAPIDTRSAFVLSLVDGQNTVESLLDMAGMPEAEVRAILDRLARLGLISLP